MMRATPEPIAGHGNRAKGVVEPERQTDTERDARDGRRCVERRLGTATAAADAA